MKKMKGSGNYLRNQVRKNLAKTVLCAFLFFLILFAVGLTALYALKVNIFDAVALLVSLAPLGGFFYYLRQYRIYGGGWAGEKQVTKLLSNRLNDDYLLLNDLYLRSGGGDIDHIVLGPSGVFVLETKNWSGEITCHGDDWQRMGRRNFKGSPSLQVKRNAAKIKRIIDSSPSLRSLGIRVEGVVVFTNNHTALHLSNPTVPILKLAQLPRYITEERSASGYSPRELEEVGKEILRQKG